MLTSRAKLLAVLTLCSTTTLGACAMDDTNSGDDTTGTVNSDAVASDGTTNSSGEEQLSIVNPDSGIIINLSVKQWQTDLRAWQIFWATCRPSVTVDGAFGSMTTAATKCFQGSCANPKLAQDGTVGSQTFDAMCGSLLFIGRDDLFNDSKCPVGQELQVCT